MLHRAFKNFGDFLIFERGLNLVQRLKPNVEILIGDASESLEAQFNKAELKMINAIVVPGGPGIRRDAFPNIYPLSECVFRERIPTYFLGAGCKIYPYFKNKELLPFSSKTKFLFDYLCTFAPIGVRDIVTYRVLSLKKYPAQLNGCPAWYSHKRVKNFSIKNIKKIIFSTPAYAENAFQFIKILKKFRQKNPEIECVVSFNHGVPQSHQNSAWNIKRKMEFFILEWARKHGCKIADMSGPAINYDIYDDSDVHIGYRVHTHIYFLSMGMPSFLITEDSRGCGVLETLNTPGVVNNFPFKSGLYFKTANCLSSMVSNLNVPVGLGLKRLVLRREDISEVLYNDVMLEFERNLSSFQHVLQTIDSFYEKNMKPYIVSLP